MNVACIRHAELPSASQLFLDLLYRYGRVQDFYPHPPALEAVPEVAKAIDLPAQRREALVAALREQNPAGNKALDGHLDLLAQPGTVVVATGQQVGLYGGPAFALYKALTAARLAAELRETGTPAVAVFWLATEDHDLAEVDHANLCCGQLRTLQMRAAAEGGPNQPVGGVTIRDARIDDVRRTLADFPFGEEAGALVERCYGGEVTFGGAFAALFKELLEPYGVIQLDPTRQAVRRLAAPLMAQAIERMPELVDALTARGDELSAAGYHQQVHVSDSLSLTFLVDQNRRIALRRDDREYRGDHKSFTQDELLRRLADEPEAFSPNALLRPVLQDYLLPTAVYVGGPAELAYLAQAGVLYERLLGRMPVVYPRASFTVLDQRALKLLKRFGLGLTDCYDPRDRLTERIAHILTPLELSEQFARQGARVDRALAELDRSLAQFDSSLGEALERSSRKIKYQFEKIRNKAARESLRRDERAARDAEYLFDWIYPERTPQERYYCALPFLARFGPGFVDSVYQAVKPECVDHQMIAL